MTYQVTSMLIYRLRVNEKEVMEKTKRTQDMIPIMMTPELGKGRSHESGHAFHYYNLRP